MGPLATPVAGPSQTNWYTLPAEMDAVESDLQLLQATTSSRFNDEGHEDILQLSQQVKAHVPMITLCNSCRHRRSAAQLNLSASG